MGRQVAVQDANGHVNGQRFDGGGNLVQEIHADGGVINYRYNAFSDKTQTLDARGLSTSYRYDQLSRLLQTVRSAAGVYSVDGANNLQYVASRAITESNTWDQAGRKLSQTNGNGETLRYQYDLRGNVVLTTQPLGQTTQAAFDAQGRKVGEVDANGYASSWRYDYFGQLNGHSDIGGASYHYHYDNARQLIGQTNSRGQNQTFRYDAAGQLSRADDYALGQTTLYAYDAAGHRVREKTLQGGIVYQDNHIAYDALGRQRWVGDGHAFITTDYDKAGNRTHIQTHTITGDTGQDGDRYFQYDAMNRQTVVDALDADGSLGGQGHRIGYDPSGNRTSDTSWGNRVSASQVITGYSLQDVYGQIGTDEAGQPIYGTTESSVPIYGTAYSASAGLTTETYAYDGLNRLASIGKDGTTLDTRYYDGANRLLQSGPAGALSQADAAAENGTGAGGPPLAGNGSETHINRFDANE